MVSAPAWVRLCRRPPEKSAARGAQALVQNTSEQTLLAVLTYAAWLLARPTSVPGLAIHCAVLFSVARLLFFAGYARGAAPRSLGFALTFYRRWGCSR
jgi:hypothetical protein